MTYAQAVSEIQEEEKREIKSSRGILSELHSKR